MDWDTLTPIEKVRRSLDRQAGDDFYRAVDDVEGDEITLLIRDEEFKLTLRKV